MSFHHYIKYMYMQLGILEPSIIFFIKKIPKYPYLHVYIFSDRGCHGVSSQWKLYCCSTVCAGTIKNVRTLHLLLGKSIGDMRIPLTEASNAEIGSML